MSFRACWYPSLDKRPSYFFVLETLHIYISLMKEDVLSFIAITTMKTRAVIVFIKRFTDIQDVFIGRDKFVVLDV